jgi:hypothetical protein
MSGLGDLSDTSAGDSRKIVGVTSVAAARERPRLLQALEQVLPVTFQECETTALDALDGLLIFGEGGPRVSPRSAVSPVRCPTLRLSEARDDGARESRMVRMARDAQLAHPLRGRLLREDCARVICSERPTDDDLVFATIAESPVWWSTRNEHAWADHSAFVPQELDERESLRECLRVGRFMGLLPVLHFLWRLCGELDGDERPLRAAFVIDDPNLHRASYGYLDYARLAGEAVRHAYHVAFATVPLDGWFVGRRTAQLMRDNRSAISLLVHGNDHTTEELGRLTDERQAQSVLAQALRRTQALESRSGVVVDRVMVPPHEVCSTVALKTMFRLGFEAACIGRGHPWIKSQSTSPLSWALVKWFSADIVDDGLPIIPRYPMDQAWEDLVFRALLGQPLILFSHHWDFAEGIDVLARAAEYVNGLGVVRWSSIGSIARQSYTVKRDADRLIVDMYSRSVRVGVPGDVRAVEIRMPRGTADEHRRRLICNGAQLPLEIGGVGRDGWRSGLREVIPGTPLELRLTADRPLEASRVVGSRRVAWPLVRRALVEGRDRVEPYSRGLRLR